MATAPRRAGLVGTGLIGGSIGMADPEAKVGFSYSVNRMHARGDNGPRARRLIDALFTCLGGRAGA